jgi:ABC-type glycerol-3-phosphate transport system substrate-binding protein
MKQLVVAGAMALMLAGCGGGNEPARESTAEFTASSTASASASTPDVEIDCMAGGLDAMAALGDFQLEMDDAQKAGKITVDQLTASRDKLFNETQAAQEKEDWTAYCKAIDDTRAELGL